MIYNTNRYENVTLVVLALKVISNACDSNSRGSLGLTLRRVTDDNGWKLTRNSLTQHSRLKLNVSNTHAIALKHSRSNKSKQAKVFAFNDS